MNGEAVRLDSKWGRIILEEGYMKRIQNVEFGSGKTVIESITVRAGGQETALSSSALKFNAGGLTTWGLEGLEVSRRVTLGPEEDEPREINFAVEITCRNLDEGKKDVEVVWSIAPQGAKVASILGQEGLIWGQHSGSKLESQELVVLISNRKSFSITNAGDIIRPRSFVYHRDQGRVDLTYTFPLWRKGSEERVSLKGQFFLQVESVFSRTAFIVAHDSWEGGCVAASCLSAREMVAEKLPSTGLTYLEQIRRYPHHRHLFADMYTPLFWFEEVLPESVIETLMNFPYHLDAVFLVGEVRPVSNLKKLLALIWQMKGKATTLHIFTADRGYQRQVEDFKDLLKLDIGLQAGGGRDATEVEIIRVHPVENLSIDIRRVLEEEFLQCDFKSDQVVVIPGGSPIVTKLGVVAAPLARYLVAPLLPVDERLSQKEIDYLKGLKARKAILIGQKDETRRLRSALDEAGLRLDYDEISGYDEYEVSRQVALRLLGYRLVDRLLWEIEGDEKRLPSFWPQALEQLAEGSSDFLEVKEKFERLQSRVVRRKAEVRDIDDFYAPLTDDRGLLTVLLKKLVSEEVSARVQDDLRAFCRDPGRRLTERLVITDVSLDEIYHDFNTALSAATYASAQNALLMLTRTLDRGRLVRITELMDDLISDFELRSQLDFEREFTQDLLGLGEAIYYVIPQPSRELLYLVEPQSLVLAPSQANAAIPYELMYDREKASFLSLDYNFGRFSALSAEDTASLMAVSAGREQIPPGEEIAPVVISNPTQDLPSAAVEGRLVRDLFLQAGLPPERVQFFETFEARERVWAHNASSVNVMHYAGHGDFDAIMPLASRLLLADQDLTALDVLYKIKFARLPIVFANACISGRMGTSQGLPYSFLRVGAPNYVGSLWPVGDVQALIFAVVFYSRLLSGYSIGEAVRAGKVAGYTLERKKMADFTWASFLMYGDPSFVLVETGRPDAEQCETMVRAGLKKAIGELTGLGFEKAFVEELEAQIDDIVKEVCP